MSNQNIVQFYSEKYTELNPISKWLLQNFYQNLKDLFLQIPENERQTVFETGCGPGFSTQTIVGFADIPKFFASDVDDKLVAEMSQKCPTAITDVESIYTLKKDSNFADVVFCLEVIEHLEQPKKALAEITRVSGKWVIVSVPNEPIWRILNMVRGKYLTSWGNTPGHLNHWGTGGFSEFLEQKCTIVSRKTPLPWQMYLCKVK